MDDVHPALRRLDPLVGEWRMLASVAGEQVASGRTVFSWLEGGAFLRQYAEGDPALPNTEWVANSPFPVTAIIGVDDTSGTFTMLYADARAVSRVYQMTVADGVWTSWRAAPGFHQRFTATISPDAGTITGRWEGSPDGTTWTLDFDVTYTKVEPE